MNIWYVEAIAQSDETITVDKFFTPATRMRTAFYNTAMNKKYANAKSLTIKVTLHTKNKSWEEFLAQSNR